MGVVFELKGPRPELFDISFAFLLTIDETGEVVGASPATVKREWQVAKLWLQREMEGN